MAQAQPLMVTVDVEPDWGVRGTRALVEVVPRLLDLFERRGMRVTFFVVSDLLRQAQAASVLRRAAGRHEIASHGETHALLTRLSAPALRRELYTSRRMLEDALGVEVRGFRAPFLKEPPLLCEFLAEQGYWYDSSLGGVAPSPRNVPAPRWRPLVATAANGTKVVRLPTTSLRCGWIPFSLTWLRLLHPAAAALVDRRAPIVYLHPHELLPAATASVLPTFQRMALGRHAGARAWEILDRLLGAGRRRTVTCREFLAAEGLLPSGSGKR